jgi:hypothetical protein
MNRRSGFVAVIILVFGLALAILSAMLARTFGLELLWIQHAALRDMSRDLAEAGLEKAIHEYLHDPEYRGEEGFVFVSGSIDIELTPDDEASGAFTIVACGTAQSNNREFSTTIEAACRIQSDVPGVERADVLSIRMLSSRGGRPTAVRAEEQP